MLYLKITVDVVYISRYVIDKDSTSDFSRDYQLLTFLNFILKQYILALRQASSGSGKTKQELKEVLKFPIGAEKPDEVGLKNAPIYIDPSSHFVSYEILCSSNYLGRTSPRCCS